MKRRVYPKTTYVVQTQSDVNEHMLHHCLKREFVTPWIEEAIEVFEKEVEYLRKEYYTFSQFSKKYPLWNGEGEHPIYCSILAYTCNDDGVVVENIQDSEFFYGE